MSGAKFRNIRTNGFDSKKESRRAQDLQLLQKIGEISDLEFQVRFEVIPKQDGERAAVYVADFVYKVLGQKIVEDCKGFKTPDYILKRKLMLYKYGIRILET